MAVNAQQAASPAAAQYRKKSFLETFAPRWALRAGDWLIDQNSDEWRSMTLFVGTFLGVITLLVLLGNGYTSLQGLLIPLGLIGLPVPMAVFPPLLWWIFPAVLVLTQIICKQIPAIRLLWRISVWFDGLTTSIFLAFMEIALLNAIERPIEMSFTSQGLWAVGVSASIIGLLLSVGAEQGFLGVITILIAAFRYRKNWSF